MKFAKHLARAMDVSDPEWHPFWVNYKQLKKVLKQSAAVAAASNNSSSSPLGKSSAAAAALAPPRRPTGGSTPNDDEGRSLEQRHKRSKTSAVAAPILSATPPASTTGTSTMAAAAAAILGKITTENGASHRGDAEGVAASVNTTRADRTKEEMEPAAARLALTAAVVSTKPPAAATGDRAVNGKSNSTTSGSDTPPREDAKLARGFRDNCRDGLETASGFGETASSAAVVLACCGNSASSCAASAVAAATANASGVEAASSAAALGDDNTAAGAADIEDDAHRGLLLQQRRRRRRRLCECPFFSALLREVDKCRIFFLENEDELKARTKRLQLALDHLKRPDLSRLSSVKGAHMKLMQACVNFYRDALLVEDFAMLNYTAVIKLLKKRDKLAGTSDQRPFMAEVMANQPFAMYPGVAKRVVQVEQIFRDIEHMCFLRTGEGMKSVMKNELTVVEAFMQ
ncbi:unnamed protein product, partial [Ectocarpus sp. 12 AP-2014]